MLSSLLTEELFYPFLVFVRVGAIVSLLPGFSATHVSLRIRVLLALAISIVVTPILSGQLPPPPQAPVALGLLMLGETLIGAFIGSIARILISALHAAGTMSAYFASLASAVVQDPVADQQSSTLAGFFATTGVTLIFVTDLHHLMLQGIVDGYRVFPVGALPPIEDFASAVCRLLSESFLVAVQLSAPLLIVGVGSQIALGLLGRLMPQLPVFFFGLPLQLGLQIWVAMLSLSGIMLVFLNFFAESLSAVLTP